jgi:hypothetical protein
MSTMSVPLEEHPLLRCLASVGAALDDAGELDPLVVKDGQRTHMPMCGDPFPGPEQVSEPVCRRMCIHRHSATVDGDPLRARET